jgi:hypothetical protein
LKGSKEDWVGIHYGSEPRDRRNHEEEITDKRSKNRAEPGTDTISGCGVENGKSACSWNQLKDKNGGKKACVVLNVKH